MTMPILPFTEPIKAILADGASIGKVMAYGELAYEKGGGATPEVYLFDDWNPEVTHTRNTEPKNMWAVSHNLSENKRSVLLPANVTNPNGVLSLSIKKEAATYSGTTTAYTSGLVYSKKAFGLGRTDVIANLCWNKTIKNSIWLTTSAYTDASTGKLLKLHEHDVVEWACNDTKQYNTSRGMWMWQENKQSVGADRLPYIDFEEDVAESRFVVGCGQNGQFLPMDVLSRVQERQPPLRQDDEEILLPDGPHARREHPRQRAELDMRGRAHGHRYGR